MVCWQPRHLPRLAESVRRAGARPSFCRPAVRGVMGTSLRCSLTWRCPPVVVRWDPDPSYVARRRNVRQAGALMARCWLAGRPVAPTHDEPAGGLAPSTARHSSQPRQSPRTVSGARVGSGRADGSGSGTPSSSPRLPHARPAWPLASQPLGPTGTPSHCRPVMGGEDSMQERRRVASGCMLPPTCRALDLDMVSPHLRLLQ